MKTSSSSEHEHIIMTSASDSTDTNGTAAGNHNSSLSIATQQGIYVTPHPPVGLVNYGNTCYANATLQCLMSTALASALMDPRCFVVFRRYASNVKLLELEATHKAEQHLNGEKGRSRSYDRLTRQRKQSSGSEASISRHQQLHESSASVPDSRMVVINKSNSDARSHSSVSTNSTRKRQLRMKSETCKWLTDELVKLCKKYRASPTTSFFGRVEPVDPSSLTRNVSRLSKCLQYGRQEDAHEFLRALLGTLVMDGQNRKLSALFDGLLESAVTCCTCGNSSLTRDRYMDLSLEIDSPDCEDLMSALRHFTRTETLSKDNLVDCVQCEKRQQVTKGLRLATAPTILVLHLKRFSYDKYGRLMRLSNHISFPPKLSIAEFMSRANKSVPRLYELVGVLVHVGKSCNRGHYIAYINSGGLWFKASDSDVEQVSESVVLDQGAYMLMYQVESVKKHRAKGLVKVRPGTAPQMYPNIKDSSGPFSMAKLLNIFDSCGMTTMSNCWGQVLHEHGIDSEKPFPPHLIRSSSSADTETQRSRHNREVIVRSMSAEPSKEVVFRSSRSEGPHVRYRDSNPLQVTKLESSTSFHHHTKSSICNHDGNQGNYSRKTETPQDGAIMPRKVALVRGASSGNLKERGEAAAKAYSSGKATGTKSGEILSKSIHVSSPSRSSKSDKINRNRPHSSSPKARMYQKFVKRSNSSASAGNERIPKNTLPKR